MEDRLDYGRLDRHWPRHRPAADRAGVKVAASARSAEKLRDLGPGILAVPLDVTDAAACRRRLSASNANLVRIDLAVLGAGTYSPVAIDDLDPKRFAHMMTTNYMGVVNCIAALAPRMMARGPAICHGSPRLPATSACPRPPPMGPPRRRSSIWPNASSRR